MACLLVCAVLRMAIMKRQSAMQARAKTLHTLSTGFNSMKKQLSFAQRLALQVHKAASSPMQGVTMPYGFAAYAKAAAGCKGKRLSYDMR